MQQKVILVTGASSGIGRNIARVLAGRGYRVFGTSRTPKTETLDGFELLKLDVTSDESAAACVQQVLEKAGRLDVLVNNAGIEMTGAAEETSIDEAKTIFETNFFGVMRMTKAVLPHMRARKSGIIINISSVAGLGGTPFQSFYSASKFALEGFTESMSYEVAPFNIRMALVEPGYFKSNIAQGQWLVEHPIPAYDRSRQRVLAAFERHLETAPDPTPIAHIVDDIITGRSKKLRHILGVEGVGVRYKLLFPHWLIAQRIRWMLGLDDLYMDATRSLPVAVWFLVLGTIAMLLGWRRRQR